MKHGVHNFNHKATNGKRQVVNGKKQLFADLLPWSDAETRQRFISIVSTFLQQLQSDEKIQHRQQRLG